MVSPGQLLTLTVDKPAAGGRMIARADGQVVLVSGAIPGERITARVERVRKGVIYADTASIEQPSLDRRTPAGDPLCGGCLFSHIAYPRQLTIKAELIADGFSRIAHLPLEDLVHVEASEQIGYRMRARLHVSRGRVGFFREGTHALCDARNTGQLLPATCDVLDRLSAGLQSLGTDTVHELELSENIDATERVVQLESAERIDRRPLASLARDGLAGLTGLTVGGPPNAVEIFGRAIVTDVLALGGHELTWRRHVLSFFQGNRYLLRTLVEAVANRIEPGSRVVDLYAGGGLFAVAAAVVRDAHVIAVEGDRVSAADLAINAVQSGGRVRPLHQPVEAFVTGSNQETDLLILDPPRTGMSTEASSGAAALGARRILYVSCDVATLARDARRIVDAGYRLTNVRGFDMFPNTPHVEAIAEFENLKM